jgi:DNA-binding LytR/AlgR family response regulator
MIHAIALDDEPLALKVIESFCASNERIVLVKTFTKPSEAREFLATNEVHLIFCDIQMPSITGINFIRELTAKPMIIFTTAFSEYAAVSYELNAIDYLLKPINKDRFDQAISKANDYYLHLQSKEDSGQQFLFVRAEYSLVKIALSEILYFETMDDYIKIHLKDKKPILTLFSMKKILERLTKNQFVRVHRSYIVPIEKISSVRSKSLFLGTQEIPIGESYKKDFFDNYRV